MAWQSFKISVFNSMCTMSYVRWQETLLISHIGQKRISILKFSCMAFHRRAFVVVSSACMINGAHVARIKAILYAKYTHLNTRQPCKLPANIYICNKKNHMNWDQFNSNTHCADEYFGSVDNAINNNKKLWLKWVSIIKTSANIKKKCGRFQWSRAAF